MDWVRSTELDEVVDPSSVAALLEAVLRDCCRGPGGLTSDFVSERFRGPAGVGRVERSLQVVLAAAVLDVVVGAADDAVGMFRRGCRKEWGRRRLTVHNRLES